MNPDVWRDFALRRQLDHVDRRLIATVFRRIGIGTTLKFPDRRIARAADGMKRDAGAGLATMHMPSSQHCAISGEIG